jgi:mannose-6-phosphate isomerase-like protein (cupin superfamily)
MKKTCFPVCLALAVLAPSVLAGPAPGGQAGADGATAKGEKMKTWSIHAITKLLEEREASGRPYLGFLRVPALHAGVYVLPKGASDLQQPHDDDEIYYVLEGRAGFLVDGEETEVEPGAVIYVKAGAEHRFHSIEEDLKLLVFFSTAESD